MKRMLDFFILNILWIVFCIPIVTVGAATCAAYYVNLKLVDDEDISVVKLFLSGFKQNLKQGTIMWLFTAPCIYAVYLLWTMIIKSDDYNFFIMIAAIVYSLIIAIVVLYSFPIIARYYTDLKTAVKNCFGTAILNIKSTIVIFVLVAIEVVFFTWNKYTQITGIIAGPEVVFLTISYNVKKSFAKIEKSNAPAAAEKSSEDDEKYSDE